MKPRSWPCIVCSKQLLPKPHPTAPGNPICQTVRETANVSILKTIRQRSIERFPCHRTALYVTNLNSGIRRSLKRKNFGVRRMGLTFHHCHLVDLVNPLAF